MSIKGAVQWKSFKAGKSLTRKGAILAQCYECNGCSDEDCHGLSCPLYQWSACNKNAKLGRLDKGNIISESKRMAQTAGIRAWKAKKSATTLSDLGNR